MFWSQKIYLAHFISLFVPVSWDHAGPDMVENPAEFLYCTKQEEDAVLPAQNEKQNH